MRDERIIDLFFARSQQALEEVRVKYGARLFSVALNITGDYRDAEECLNDALLVSWNRIPPERPSALLPWLSKVVRNTALTRWEREHAQKRGGGLVVELLDELTEVLPSGESTESAYDRRELARAVAAFVRELHSIDRTLFLGRYFAGESYEELSRQLGISVNACKMRVSRVRKKLRKKLSKEGAV